ncbi:MAG: ParB/RepB/Spo0J family partition protein [Clostridiales bacterium]|nr:ParB/RepB/Spo0J family partition protein [Candidatus Apopatousia equi]
MKNGLGRGLESLFSVYRDEEVDVEKADDKIEKEPAQVKVVKMASLDGTIESEAVHQIDVKMIDPNKDQPRKSFDEQALKDLSASIKIHGIIQPIVLNKVGARYMIIAGERRWRAAQLAGLTAVPAIVKNYDAKQIKEISIIENLQREDLNPMEAARAIKQLMEEYGWTQEIVADRLGKSRPVIANTIRLLNLEPEVIEMIEKGKLSAGHARSLVGVSDRAAQIRLAKQVCEKKLTVRDLEKAVKYGKAGKNPQSNQSVELKELIHDMQKVFGTKVTALGSDQRGRIYIDYYNVDDLQRIYSLVEILKKH